MEELSIKPGDSIFKYGAENVSINCGGDNLNDKFDSPSFYDSEKKVLVITPKTNYLIDYITNILKVAYIDFTISFGKNICVQNDETILPLSDEAQTKVNIRYTAQKEEDPPVEYEFFVTNREVSLSTGSAFFAANENIFNYERNKDPDSDSEYELMLQNRTNGIIYIYGKYYDGGSGVRAVTVNEKLVNNYTDGVSVIAQEYPHIYLFGSDNADFIRDSGGNTFFCIKHTLLSGDGAVAVDIDISDVAGNSAPEKNLVVLKKSQIEMDFTVTNEDGVNSLINASFPENGEQLAINEQNLKEQLKVFRIKQAGFFPDYYPVSYLTNDFVKKTYNFKCKYLGKETDEFNYVYEGASLEWEFKLDVQNIAGLEFTINVSDDIGNTVEKTYKVPDINSIATYREEISGSTDEQFCYIISRQKNTKIAGGFYIEERNSNKFANYLNRDHSLNSLMMVENNKTYKISPQIMDDKESYCIYLDILDDLSVDYESDITTIQKIELKKDPQTNKPIIDFEKTDELFNYEPMLKVTIHIDDESWKNDKYDFIIFTYQDYKKVLFDYKKTTCSILMVTRELYEDETPFTIYGYKDGKRSEETADSIPKLTGTENDNIKPYIDINRESWNSYIITINDDESGPENGTVIVNGISDPYYIYSGSYEVTIPVKNVVRKYSVDGTGHTISSHLLYIDYWLYDQAKNCQYEKDFDIEIGYIPVVKSYTKETNSWTLESEYNTEFVSTIPDSFEFWELDKDNPDSDYYWKYLGKRDSESNLQNGLYGYYYTSTFSNSGSVVPKDLPSKKYIKVIANCDTVYSVPSYFYTGGKSYEKGDIILPYTANSVLVQSTQPAYVHTVFTTASYEECKKWSAEDWDYFTDSLGFEFLDFETYPMQLEYEIPVDFIESDRRYAVVAHFASGKTAVSQVFSK